MAKSSSVVAGMSETTRRAGAEPRPCRPHRPRRWSCRAPARAAARRRGRAGAASNETQAGNSRSGNRNPPVPRGGGRAMSDGESSRRHATDPPPRVSWWRERRGLLASGLRSPSRLPSGVVSEEPASWSGARYSGGAAPVLHRLPSIPIRVASIVLRGSSRTGRARGRKSALELRLEPRALRSVALPLLGRRLRLAARVARVERGDGVEQLGRRAASRAVTAAGAAPDHAAPPPQHESHDADERGQHPSVTRPLPRQA